MMTGVTWMEWGMKSEKRCSKYAAKNTGTCERGDSASF